MEALSGRCLVRCVLNVSRQGGNLCLQPGLGVPVQGALFIPHVSGTQLIFPGDRQLKLQPPGMSPEETSPECPSLT